MSGECNICGHNGCVEDNHPDPDLRDAEEYTRHMAQARKHHGALARFVQEYDARARRIAELEARVEDGDDAMVRLGRMSVDMCQVARGASRIQEENEAARRLLTDERAANAAYEADLAAARTALARSAVIEARAREVAAQWDRMLRCYHDSESSVRLGELLDAQCEALGEGT